MKAELLFEEFSSPGVAMASSVLIMEDVEVPEYSICIVLEASSVLLHLLLVSSQEESLETISRLRSNMFAFIWLVLWNANIDLSFVR